MGQADARAGGGLGLDAGGKRRRAATARRLGVRRELRREPGLAGADSGRHRRCFLRHLWREQGRDLRCRRSREPDREHRAEHDAESPAHRGRRAQRHASAPGGSPSQAVFDRTLATTPTSFGDGSTLAGPYTFSDTAPASPTWWEAAAATGAAAIPAGSYRPSTPGESPSGGANTLFLPVFAAATPNGTWTLRFRDKCAGDSGSVSAATLLLNEPPEEPRRRASRHHQHHGSEGQHQEEESDLRVHGDRRPGRRKLRVHARHGALRGLRLSVRGKGEEGQEHVRGPRD